MLEVFTDSQMIRFGERLGVSFHRTLRIPEKDQSYPLPPGLGRFPIYRVSDFADSLPQHWEKSEGAVFIPMYQREALWIGFNPVQRKSSAVTVGVGGVNALSGESMDAPLMDEPQNYLVAPPQPWLDGIHSGHAAVRQFIAMPLGHGRTIEAAVSGREQFGGIQIAVYEPKPGKIPPDSKAADASSLDGGIVRPMHMPVQSMGFGAGGRILQKIYPDPYGLETWNPDQFGRATLYIVNSLEFERITGRRPPPTPVDARLYTEHGMPWFAWYDEAMADISPSETLTRLYGEDPENSHALDSGAEEDAFEIPGVQIQTIGGSRTRGKNERALKKRLDRRSSPDGHQAHQQKQTSHPLKKEV